MDDKLMDNYQIIVKDYGELNQDNFDDFLSGDISILILGAKVWELTYSEKVLNNLIEQDNIMYLFNFVDGLAFREAVQCMNGKNCSRIPYVTNPFKGYTGENMKELIQDIFKDYSLNQKKEPKINRFIHKLSVKIQKGRGKGSL